MFSKIIFTFITRFSSSLIGFLLVILTAHAIGAEGRGEISLIILGTAITLLISSIIGGNAIVLLAPSTPAFKLLVPSYGWALISISLITTLLHFTGLIPQQYSIHIFIISLLQAIASIHMSLFIGKQQIKLYNIMNLLQVFLLFTAAVIFYYFLNYHEVIHYIVALYISFAIQALVTTWFIYREIEITSLSGVKEIIKKILENGLVIQLCNVVQILNYRLCYFILEETHGMTSLGIFSTASIVAESVWLVSRSISLVQYSGIVNSSDKEYNRFLTVRMAKLSLVGSILVMIPVLLLPSSFYGWILGEEFRAILVPLWIYAPGILALSFATVLGHYFAGLGLNKVNLTGSLIGFGITLFFSLILIPKWGINGAAVSVCLAYCVHSVYLFLKFRTHTSFKIIELWPSTEDFIHLKKGIGTFLGRSFRK
ncbi:MAG: polysaccharide biosynthesis C-terminal domain-containing protein [Bacteroidetes bacterium]|nr:polysaccharide biosynthesis C-terminal domain-containing protein [Bacteroidota bacterium]